MIHRLLLATLLLAGCAASVTDGNPDQQRSAAQDFTRAPVALFGDVPYSFPHANLLDGMIDEINKARPVFAVHLGDITGGLGPCTDTWFKARKAQFARITAPFVLVPGDNEWTDCHRSGRDPLERLDKLRRMFHSEKPALPEFTRQSTAWPEHMRWSSRGTLFISLNVPGSNNNLGRTPAMDAEHAARMKAVLAWLYEALDLAGERRYQALVVLMHANPHFEAAQRPANLPDGYGPLREALEAGARRLAKPLVVAHGDTHRFKNDRPVPGVPNLQRIEVDGWPQLGWLALRVTNSPSEPIEVERFLSKY